MIARFSWNQRKTGGHRPPLEQPRRYLDRLFSLRSALANSSVFRRQTRAQARDYMLGFAPMAPLTHFVPARNFARRAVRSTSEPLR
jgi:hypothetical protein